MNNSVNTFNCISYDTAGNTLYIVLIQNDAIVDKQSIPNSQERYHTAILLPTIQNILKNNGLTIQDMTALGVGIGPGSFTGIRAGVVIARTLGQFLNIPIIPINTSELLLHTLTRACLLLDAKRGQAYFADSQLKKPELIELSLAKNFILEDIETILTDSFLHSTIADRFPQKHILTITDIKNDFAQILGTITLEKYRSKMLCQWQEVMPLYLQQPGITVSSKKT